MTKWVYRLRRRRGRGPRATCATCSAARAPNLAEMSSLGLPVPPGFTITTEVCTHFYANGKTYPAELEGAGRARRSPRSRAIVGARFGDAANPLLVSVRSGARVSMPGMMDTVLNLGLNDATVAGPGRAHRRRALRLRQLSPLHPDVRQRRARRRASPFRGAARAPQGRPRRRPRHRARRRRLADAWSQAYKAMVAGGARQALPAGPAGAALGRDRRRVRLAG